jgi:hypothetical protein
MIMECCKYQRGHFWMILQYFGIKIRFFSVEKENKLHVGPKQFFFLGLPVEKENNTFSSQNIVIASQNIIPDDLKKT